MDKNLRVQERKKPNLREVIFERFAWLIYVLILGLLSSSLLMAVSYLAPVHGEGLDLEGKMLILRVLGVEHEPSRVEAVFAESITTEEIEGLTLYWSEEGKVAFKFTGMGFQGTISGLIALGPELETVEGLVILEQQETPGLGGRIVEEAFLNQFRGLALSPQIVVLPTGVEAVAPHEVEGITGATMTSKALETMLRENIREILKKLEVKGNG